MTHPLAWSVWLLATMGIALSTRNPLYLVLVLLASFAVARRNPIGPLWLLIVFAALFNALFTRAGTTVLLRLPFSQVSITAEALAYGALNGLVLLTLLAAFQAFNAALRPRDLLALTPRAFYSLALATTIAITYLPLLRRQAQAIWEAQRIRGHSGRGWRAWGPVLLPLLMGSLERAFALAEALATRGFIIPTRQRPWALSLGLALALVGALGVLLWPGAWAALALGLALMAWALWRAGRTVPRRTHVPYPWRWRDTAGVLGALLALGALALDPARTYLPYPALSLPPFTPLTGLALLGLLAAAQESRHAGT